MRDLYEARTVARLANAAAITSAQQIPKNRAQPISRPRGRPFLSTTIQSVWLIIELVIGSAIVYTVVFKLLPLLLRDIGLLTTAFLAPLLGFIATLVYAPISIGLVVLLKSVLIGRYRPMSAPVWGGFFTRHWIVSNAARLIPWSFFEGTFFTTIALRALGATIGQRVHIHRGVDLRHGGWDLLNIGDDVTICQDAAVRLVEFEAGQLIVGPITISDGATLDTRAGISPNSTMGRNSYLTALSWLSLGAHVAENEQWDESKMRGKTR